jgi:hypothetical protein
MRNRNLFFNKLELVENDLKVLKLMVNRQQPVRDFIDKVTSIEDVVSDLKSMVEKEPLSPSELNKI